MELEQQINKFELKMMMGDYNEKIKKAKSEGNYELAEQLFKESFKKAKDLGWEIPKS